MFAARTFARSRGRAVAIGLVLLGGGTCSAPDAPSSSNVSELDDSRNYREVFDEEVPRNVEIVHSIVIDYGIASSPDWAFELLAPQSWIDEKIAALYLKEAISEYSKRQLMWRLARPIRAWYSPRPETEYDRYYCYLTSSPYIQLCARKAIEPDSRRRVFVSKH